MFMEVPRRTGQGLRLTAALANGVLVGASLDHSIKQLRAERRLDPSHIRTTNKETYYSAASPASLSHKWVILRMGF